MATLLVVDDDPVTLECITELLVKAGHDVSTAADGLQARTLVKWRSFDAVLTDISMPNEDGIGLLLALRHSHPAPAVVVISGQDWEVLDDAVRLGAHAAFRKPVDTKALFECLAGLPKHPTPVIPEPRSV